MARSYNAYPYRRRFGANRGDDHCPNSSDLGGGEGGPEINRHELISCETLLAGWHSHTFILFAFAIEIATSSILFCFQHFPCSAFAISGGFLHLFLSPFSSQLSCSPSLDSKNIGGAKPLGAAGGLVVGLQGVLYLSPTSEEFCKPTRRPENRLECCRFELLSTRDPSPISWRCRRGDM
jgi:hypothetical protein